jgi:hypothetical protein
MTKTKKRYKVTLHVEQRIDANDEDEALGIFWDDLHEAAAEEELATIEEVGKVAA